MADFSPDNIVIDPGQEAQFKPRTFDPADIVADDMTPPELGPRRIRNLAFHGAVQGALGVPALLELPGRALGKGLDLASGWLFGDDWRSRANEEIADTTGIDLSGIRNQAFIEGGKALGLSEEEAIRVAEGGSPSDVLQALFDKHAQVPGGPARGFGENYIETFGENAPWWLMFRKSMPTSDIQKAGMVTGAPAGQVGLEMLADKAMGIAEGQPRTPWQELGAAGAGLTGDVAGTVIPGSTAKGASALPRSIGRMGRAIAGVTPEVMKYAKALGVDPQVLVDQVGYVKSWFPQGVRGSTNEPHIADAAEKLEDAAIRYPDWESGPSTDQVLHESSGEMLRGVAEDLGKAPGSGRGVTTRREGQRIRHAQATQDDLNRLGGGNVDRLGKDAKTGGTRLTRDARAKWDTLEPELDDIRMGEFSTGLVDTASDIMRRAGERGAHNVPDDIKWIANELTPETSMRELQAMKATLGDIAREAEKTGLHTTSSGFASRMLGEIRTVQRGIGESGVSEALQAANAATAKKHRLLKPNARFNRNMKKFQDGELVGDESVQLGIDAISSRQNARRAKELVSMGGPGAQENMGKVVTDAIFGTELFGDEAYQSARAIRKSLKKYKSGLVELFGQEHYDDLKNLSVSFGEAKSTRPGTAAAVMGAGSARQQTNQTLATTLGLSGNMTSAFGGAAKEVSNQLKGLNDPQIRIITERFFAEPGFAAFMLRRPEPREVPRWALEWQRLIKTTLSKEAAQSVPGVPDSVGNITEELKR
jgi:hypothetical protein